MNVIDPKAKPSTPWTYTELNEKLMELISPLQGAEALAYAVLTQTEGASCGLKGPIDGLRWAVSNMISGIEELLEKWPSPKIPDAEATIDANGNGSEIAHDEEKQAAHDTKDDAYKPAFDIMSCEQPFHTLDGIIELLIDLSMLGEDDEVTLKAASVSFIAQSLRGVEGDFRELIDGAHKDALRGINKPGVPLGARIEMIAERYGCSDIIKQPSDVGCGEVQS